MLKSKKLRNENNQREELLTTANDLILTDMIVYLRGSDLSEYNQELVRADLIEMVYDAQKRGEDIKEVMGGNYKEICDEIIATFPKKTKREKVLDLVENVCVCVWVLSILTIVKGILAMHTYDLEEALLSISLGDLLNYVVISAVVLVFLSYFMKHVFTARRNRILSFLKTWGILLLIVVVPILISYSFQQEILKVHIGVIVVIAALGFLTEKGIAIQKERG